MPAIICENIRSAYNIGSIIRTANCFGFDVITAGFSAPAQHPKVRKTALGAEQHTLCQHYDDITTARLYAQKQYGVVLAAEIAPSALSPAQRFSHTVVKRDCCIIVGNEITGVAKGTLAAIDHTIMIPLGGMNKSLNVSVAAGIVMYEYIRSTSIDTKR